MLRMVKYSIQHCIIFSLKNVRKFETVETVESFETVETVLTEDLKKYDSLTHSVTYLLTT